VTLAILIAVVAVVVLVGIGVGLTASRRRGSAPVPPRPAPTGAAASTDERAAVQPPVAPSPEPLVEASAEQGAPTSTIERPAPVAGRMQRLRARLARSNSAVGRGLLDLLSRDSLSEPDWEAVEDVLLGADLGVGPSTELVDRLRERVKVETGHDRDSVRIMLHEELLRLVDPGLDRSLATSRHDERPAVVLMVGVNGTGKTTTVGKLARVLVAEDRSVVLGAADTFRAAAADQLETWGNRVGVRTVRSDREGADPASVAFDAVQTGIDEGTDVVLIDTAGRLQNKAGLMDELGKVKRVIERHGPVDEVLLVLDATTGQNGLRQARVFSDVVDVTGIVLTKLDGTAKGGIVVAVQRELGVPVKLVGLGEGPDDLAPFDAEAFVAALLA
jgi:fused signal recognition particle receptor